MRIDNMENSIPSTARTQVSDLLGRLNPGDVIKARVLDVQPGEAVLRLSDGSLLKARTDALDAKPGQMLTLFVTSRQEGTLYLETVKEPLQQNLMDSNKIINILKSLQMNADPQNIAIALEFTKAGVPITAEQIDHAAGLMEGFEGLDAEKAVFITTKGLQSNPASLGLLSKLLGGDLKLGDQIKELQALLGKISVSKNSVKSPDTLNVQRGSILADTSVSGQEAVIIQSSSKSPQNNSDKPYKANSLPSSTNTAIKENNQPVAANTDSIQNNQPDGTSEVVLNSKSAANDSVESTLQNTITNSASKEELSGTLQSEATASVSNNSKNGGRAALSEKITAIGLKAQATATESATFQAKTVLELKVSEHSPSSSSIITLEQPSFMLPGHAAASDTQFAVVQHLVSQLPGTAEQAVNTPTNPLIHAEDSIDKVFIDIRSDQLVEDLGLSSLHNELRESLDLLKDSILASDHTQPAIGESLAAAASKIYDSVNLLDQLNKSNMLYYQLPVNLSGFRTTAEIYIMKRQANKKRIDPHDSVMFISLDTEHMGRIETLLDVKGNCVSIALRTENAQIKDFVKENIRYLYDGLAVSGYKLAEIKYSLIDKPASPIKQEKLLSKMIEPDHTRLDMRI